MRFIFGVEEADEGYEVGIVLVNKDFWEENGYVNDGFTEKEYDFLQPILERCGLEECMEASYDITNDLETTKAMLISEGLEYSEELTEFLIGR